jgi:sterol desaturase/sphingolipid hydroxylase (fatty acid hydroxylase superfamily)
MAIPIESRLLRARPFLVHPPLTAGLVLWAVPRYDASWLSAGLLAGTGVFAWTLIEWLFHRAMHLPVRHPALARFQDGAHLRHHRHPDDVEHSVVNLRGSLPLAGLLFGLSWLVAGSLPAAVLFYSGLASGYLAYEFVHLATHAEWRVLGLHRLADYHRRHHVGNWSRSFGVTSPLWDRVFGTRPDPAARAR